MNKRRYQHQPVDIKSNRAADILFIGIQDHLVVVGFPNVPESTGDAQSSSKHATTSEITAPPFIKLANESSVDFGRFSDTRITGDDV